MRFMKKIQLLTLARTRGWNYLKYAIGEIILVSVGVLLAVYVNNSNNKRLAAALKNELLLDLKEELQFNINRMYFLDTFAAPTMRYADSLFEKKIKLMEQGLDREEVSQLFEGPSYRFNYFNLSTDAYDQLKETGIFKTLEKEDRNAIKTYYRLLDREEKYNAITYTWMIDALENCRYGYQLMRSDYLQDSLNYLDNNPWIFDHRSKHYIDMVNYLQTVNISISSSRERMLRIIEESKILMNFLKLESIHLP